MNGSEEKSKQEHKQKTLFEHKEVAPRLCMFLIERVLSTDLKDLFAVVSNFFFCSSVLTRASLLPLAKSIY